MKGKNLERLWEQFGGKYLTNRNAVGKVLGIGHEKADLILEGLEKMAIGKGTYYRTMDVIERIENHFIRST